MTGFGEAEAVSLLVNSVKIYSPTGSEGPVSRLFSSAMRNQGFRRVRIDRAGNAIGEVGRGKIRVLLCGHIDTVPGRVPVVLEDGRLTGRGSVDAKTPMCAMLVAASRFIDDPALRLTVACATAEEGDSLGIRTLMEASPTYDFAVFGEPGGAGKVTVGYRGRTALQVSILTEGGHAGAAWAHQNAFDAASALIRQLREYEKEHSAEGDRYNSVSVSPTLFEAGEYHNVIPARARFTCDVRIPPRTTCAAVEKELGTIITAFAKSKGMAIRYNFSKSTEPYEAQPSSLLVRAFQRSILLRTKSKPVLLRKTGTGDMNIFAAVKRAQCVTYGAGETGLSHTDKESVGLEDYLQSIEVLSEALRQIKQLST